MKHEIEIEGLQEGWKPLKKKLALIGEEAINAERSTNEILTNELDKMKELQGEVAK